MVTTAALSAAAAAPAHAASGSASTLSAAAQSPSASADTFRDCPALPAGVDPSQWRCEALTATGSLTLGSRTVPALAPMTITHAEGPLADGGDGQVWGAMRSGPGPVPGGLLGIPGTADRNPWTSLSLMPEYGGRSDFYSTGNSLGLLTLRFRVLSPLLPRTCVIGRDNPVELRLQRVGGSQWVSQDPPVIDFDARDDAFAVPAATGCGPLGPLVDAHLGVPAATGNSIALSASYTFATYDRLPVG
ncbi:hypothetical protein K7862_34625 [Streptomyces sp. PLK6-54]|uniref:Secreted protein n=1 Tax=Actinacidiphila acidipaludis TaxID=2873382 RepID=A0ABS7QJY7_9ACTN|nr:hypothetical protein [Streptomyces acidipaludis]